MKTKKLAKMAVALKMCEILHAQGEIVIVVISLAFNKGINMAVTTSLAFNMRVCSLKELSCLHYFLSQHFHHFLTVLECFFLNLTDLFSWCSLFLLSPLSLSHTRTRILHQTLYFANILFLHHSVTKSQQFKLLREEKLTHLMLFIAYEFISK